MRLDGRSILSRQMTDDFRNAAILTGFGQIKSSLDCPTRHRRFLAQQPAEAKPPLSHRRFSRSSQPTLQTLGGRFEAQRSLPRLSPN